MLPRPPLAISLAGLERRDDAPWAAGPRAAIDWAAAAGFTALQLDATAPGLRPRELDRSARRDLAAILRRAGLGFTGLDLWIPPEHLLDPARSERAIEAMLQAIELAADLGRLNPGPGSPAISLTWPAAASPQTLSQIIPSANRSGTPIADHSLQLSGAAPAPPSGLLVGIDPAALLMAGLDPAQAAARAGSTLASARLSDASLTGRVPPGVRGGRLDLTLYLASLSVAGYSRPLVLDLRGLSAQDTVARSVVSDW